MGLRFKKVDKKVPFVIFRENIGNYIVRTIKYGNKVVGIVETYEYVQDTYKTNRMPKMLTIEDKKFEVKVHIQNHRIKIYITNEMEMVNNIDSVYSNIWGQCIEPLQNMINLLNEINFKQK